MKKPKAVLEAENRQMRGDIGVLLSNLDYLTELLDGEGPDGEDGQMVAAIRKRHADRLRALSPTSNGGA